MNFHKRDVGRRNCLLESPLQVQGFTEVSLRVHSVSAGACPRANAVAAPRLGAKPLVRLE